ncbi:MAG: hypothetical protein KDA91_10945, partial [Planctomycetaceae bacterium]|nr:hypothetical protein [Planctomycetaceae bacterium]
MATVIREPGQSYAESDEFIDFQLRVARERIKSTELMTAIVLTGLLLTGYVLIFTVLDHWVIAGGFSAGTRAAMLATMVVICTGIFIRYVVRPWFRHIHPLFAARMLDRADDQIRGSLLTLVDLRAAGRETDPAIVQTLERRTAERLSEVHVDEVIDRTHLVRMAGALFLLVLITCIYAVVSPKSISLLRPLTFLKANVATRTEILSVKPGNASLPSGSHVEFIADLEGVVPEDVVLQFTTEDKRFVNERLQMRTTEDPGRYRVLMSGEADRGIRQSFSYQILAGDAASETYTIQVQQPPTAAVTQVDYKYPDYMVLPERSDASGHIDAWEGTELRITAEATQAVTSAMLEFSDDAGFSVRAEELPMVIEDQRLSAEFALTAREDGTFPTHYRIVVTSKEGTIDPDPAVYTIKARRDESPIVRLIDPSRDLEVPENATVPLLIVAEDPDFLLRLVALHVELNGVPIQPDEVLFYAGNSSLQKRWSGTWDFKIQRTGATAGDTIKYYVVARDDKPPLGNQGRSSELTLHIQGPADEKTLADQLEADRELQERLRNEQIEEQQRTGAQESLEPASTDTKEQNPDSSEEHAAPHQEAADQERTNAGDRPQEGTSNPELGEPSNPGKQTPSDQSLNQTSGEDSNATDGQSEQQDANSERPDPGNTKSEGDENGATPMRSKTSPGEQKADDAEALHELLQKYAQDEAGEDTPETARHPSAAEQHDGDNAAQSDGTSQSQSPDEANASKEPQDSVEGQNGTEPSVDSPAESSKQPTTNGSTAPSSEQDQGNPPPDTEPEGNDPENSSTNADAPQSGDVKGESNAPMKNPAEDASDHTKRPGTGDDAGRDNDARPETSIEQPKEPAGPSEPQNDNQKQGDQKQGDQKQGDQEQGDQKQGDQKQGDQKQGDQKQGDQKQGDQKQG